MIEETPGATDEPRKRQVLTFARKLGGSVLGTINRKRALRRVLTATLLAGLAFTVVKKLKTKEA